MADKDENARRLTVSLRAKDDEDLAFIVARTGLTKTGGIRKAIATEAWFERRLAEGCTVHIRLPDGQLQEVVFIQ